VSSQEDGRHGIKTQEQGAKLVDPSEG